MAQSLGSPVTAKRTIGTFELRIGPVAMAGLHTSDQSVGIIDQVKLDLQMDSVDLLAGMPQKPVDTAITKLVTGVTATLRESSQRNLNILMGNSVLPYAAAGSDASGFVDTTSAIATSALTLTMATAFTGSFMVGAVVVIYDVNIPGNVSVCTVSAFTAKAGSTPASVTLSSNTPLVAPASQANAFPAGATVKIYQSDTVPIGAISGVPNYFSVQLLRQDRQTGRTVGINFWKCTISAGPSITNSVTEYSSYELQIKALQPAAIEYATGGALNHLAALIPSNPVALVFDVSDAATS